MIPNSYTKKNLKLEEWFIRSDFYSKKKLQDEELLISEGNIKALHLFHEAAERVPAYKDFLKKNKIDHRKIHTVNDYQQIPTTTKENYIEVNPLEKLIWDGSLSQVKMISMSSGTSGKPHYWPRSLEHEIEGALAHEFIFKESLHLNKHSTLFINGFALGNWIAGTFTNACVSLVSRKKYSLTLMSPGYSLEEVVKTIKDMGPFYKQIIISGHIPFLKEIVEAVVKNIDMPVSKIRLLGTGQGITEEWRDYILKKMRKENDYTRVLNLYGSADASLMGFETEASIYIRRMINDNTSMFKKFFEGNRLPSIYNYDPRLIYFENQDGELIITKNAGVPLIRYNIHDEGGILSHKEIIDYIKSCKFRLGKELLKWKLPFVYLYGRDKFMVKIFGANIYSEHVQHALSHEKLQLFLTGRNKLEIEYDEKHNTRLVCHVELTKDTLPKKELLPLIKQTFVDEVRQINSEFNDALNRMGERVKPTIIVYPYGHPKYFPKGQNKKNA